MRSFREGVEHYCRLFDVQPEFVAYDLHPEYLSTKYARELEEAGLPAVGVQHHHAHVASCLADNERRVGSASSGWPWTGPATEPTGPCGAESSSRGAWRTASSGEATWSTLPCPGGSAAIRQPWRMALAQLVTLYGEEETMKLPLAVVRRAGERNARLVARLVERGLNTPPTSSAGRLFDAVAALVGVPGTRADHLRGTGSGGARAGRRRPREPGLPLPVATRERRDGSWRPRRSYAASWRTCWRGRTRGEISSCFHRTMAEVVVAGCEEIRETGGTAPSRSPAGHSRTCCFWNRC